jgi:hypothetical protein
MPSPIPPRDRIVYLVGAGLSSAFDLPNTPALLQELVRFATTNRGHWLGKEHVTSRLNRAYRFFYPDAQHPGFQPDVVDFFSTLRTYLDVGAGLVGTGFPDAPEMYRLLRRGISHLLIERLRAIDLEAFKGNEFMNEVVQPGHIIITSNWDLVIEHFAQSSGIPLRLASRTRVFSENEVSLIKLHGSIDWCQQSARSAGYDDTSYAHLGELQFGPTYTMQMPVEDDSVVRIRAMPVGSAWQRIRSRAREPYIVTMARGKSSDLGPLQEVWRDAYRALSRAKRLEIVGYSMPADDVEIRTIVRTGLQRGNDHAEVVVRNPAPDVHVRVRTFLDRDAQSSFLPVVGC